MCVGFETGYAGRVRANYEEVVKLLVGEMFRGVGRWVREGGRYALKRGWLIDFAPARCWEGTVLISHVLHICVWDNRCEMKIVEKLGEGEGGTGRREESPDLKVWYRSTILVLNMKTFCVINFLDFFEERVVYRVFQKLYIPNNCCTILDVY